MSKKSILIISFTHLKNDPRVFRQIQSLHEIGYCVYAMGLSDPEIQGVHFLEITKQEGLINKLIKAIFLILKFHEQYYWSLKVVKQSLKKTEGLKFDLIIANDLETLPLAAKLKAKSNAKLLFDAHEYSPREQEDRIIWNLLFKDFVHNALKKYTSFIDKMFTVCEGISLEYAKNYNLQPIVVTNATEYIDTKPIINHNQNIKLIHHGGSIRSRKIENMIYMMDYLDKRFTLDLMLVPSQKNIIRN
ncbi:MAG: hypothetical protein IPN86_24080 [Saprospiraceae bacterium]|nr:hypothetical protein [Saprospiraceae bacterium]